MIRRLALSYTRRSHPVEEANFHHLVMDIAWFGLAFVTIQRFLSVYAIRLDATALHLALLTALPALISMITALWSQWWRARFRSTHEAVALPETLWRMMFVMLAAAPLLPPEWQPMWLVISVALPAIPHGPGQVMFLVLMREAVDSTRMAALNSRRSVMVNLTLGVGALLAGLWLESAAFPHNYQVLYLAAFGFAMLSMWHVVQVQPQRFAEVPESAAAPRQRLWDAALWRAPQLRSMAMLAALTHVAFFSVFTLIPLHLVDNLGASEGFVAAFTLVELGGSVLLSMWAAGLARRWGYARLIAVGMGATAASSVIIAFAPDLLWTLPASLILGGGWALVGIGLMGVLLEEAPASQATAYTTIYLQVVGLATFAGPFIGSALAEGGVTLPIVLLVGAGLRGAAALWIARPQAAA